MTGKFGPPIYITGSVPVYNDYFTLIARQDLYVVDFIIVNSTAKKVMDLSESREALYADLVEDMSCRAPNLATLVGDVIGARLISAPGSLPNLTKISVEEFQILDVEESHFRHYFRTLFF